MRDEIISRLNNIRHTLHAVEKESLENITAEELEQALKQDFDVIEEHPDDPRGASCLLLCSIHKSPIHVVCAPHEDALIIITVYRPDLNIWKDDYKQRRSVK